MSSKRNRGKSGNDANSTARPASTASKPASGKQKKELLKQKRLLQREREEQNAKTDDYWSASGWTDKDWATVNFDHAESKQPKPVDRGTSQGPASFAVLSTQAAPSQPSASSDPKSLSRTGMHKSATHQMGITVNPGVVSGFKEQLYYDPSKLRTVFVKETKEEVQERKLAAAIPFVRKSEPTADEGFYYREVLPMPLRPFWDHTTTKQQLEQREDRCFRVYLQAIYDKYPSSRLNYFEHNLEVWRQLWRTCEKSDILLCVADSRHPLFNFPPSLYWYATEILQKPIVLVLNKIDFVPGATLQRWREYFRSTYPQLHVVNFTSFPIDGTVTADDADPSRKRDRVLRKQKDPIGVQELLQTCLEIVNSSSAVRQKVAGVSLSMQSKHRKRLGYEERLQRRAERREKRRGRVDATRHKTSIESSEHPASDSEETEEDLDRPAESDEDDVTLPASHTGTRPYVTIGTLGHPNAGKSSLINALTGKKLVSVSKTPGHTKYFQTIFLNEHVRLCDCPGLVFPAVDMPKPLQILCGLYPIAQTREPYSSVQFLAERLPIERIYGLLPPHHGLNRPSGASDQGAAEFTQPRGSEDQKLASGDARASNPADRLMSSWSAMSLCEALAEKKAYHTRNGGLDTYRAGNEILRDAFEGRLVMYFEPPTESHSAPRPIPLDLPSECLCKR